MAMVKRSLVVRVTGEAAMNSRAQRICRAVIPDDIIMMDICHYTFVQTYQMYYIKGLP